MEAVVVETRPDLHVESAVMAGDAHHDEVIAEIDDVDEATRQRA